MGTYIKDLVLTWGTHEQLPDTYGFMEVIYTGYETMGTNMFDQ